MIGRLKAIIRKKKVEKQLNFLKSKIGESLSLDLGMIGPAEVTLSIVDETEVTFTYKYSGKIIKTSIADAINFIGGYK